MSCIGHLQANPKLVEIHRLLEQIDEWEEQLCDLNDSYQTYLLCAEIKAELYGIRERLKKLRRREEAKP